MQIPSNMILVRMGAPKWLSMIVVSWGVCATLFAAMKTKTDFYVLRFLLGVTECGTFPGSTLLALEKHTGRPLLIPTAIQLT